MWRLEIVDILVRGLVLAVMATVIISVILFVVGETMEHFTQ
jgi:hypothetical protein